MVCKLVELDGTPIIKLSSDKGKMTLPGSKNAYRVFPTEKNADYVCFDRLGSEEDDMDMLTAENIKIYDLTDNYKESVVTLGNVFLLNDYVFEQGEIHPGNEFNAQVKPIFIQMTSFRTSKTSPTLRRPNSTLTSATNSHRSRSS